MDNGRFNPTARLAMLLLASMIALTLAISTRGYIGMIVTVFGSLFLFKIITLLNHNRGVSLREQFAYLTGYTGLDAKRFFNADEKPVRTTFIQAALKSGLLIYLGITFILIGLYISYTHPLTGGWLEMIGLAQIMHFGFFELVQNIGPMKHLDLKPLMQKPLEAKSVSEFWGKAWNTAFSDLTREYLFGPLAKFAGPKVSLLIGFIFSGFLHELVITFPARGGYGLPTLYFAIQGIGMLLERTRPFKNIKGRLWTILIAAGPVPILFPPVFVTRVIVPMFQDLAAALKGLV